jgi:DNA topoisomerase-1
MGVPVRLRRSDPSRPGYTRRRRGRGFSYHQPSGAALTDTGELERIQSLVLPPAWRDVWISTDPRGHIQAVGTDAAGRRQYRYHDEWRRQRDAAKFDHVLDVGARLPAVRETVAGHLGGRGFGRERVLAVAVRLLDVGCFRIGGEEYAAGDDATFGLATLRREHVELPRGAVRFRYPAKGGVQRVLDVDDEDVRTVVKALLAREPGQEELLAYRNGAGWSDVRSADINAYLREVSGIDITAKDFRTWNGTVLAASLLAEAGAGARSRTARTRAVAGVMREVAEYLGNTPAVARSSYVDPRVVDLYRAGTTIPSVQEREKVERAVLELLGG